MTQDEEGFAYPEIDKNSCINCHLCEKVCPVEHPDYSNNDKPDVYAVLLKDVEERKKSSSGGAFFAIAKFVLNNNGVVIGATMDEMHQVRHIMVESLDELFRLRGSKYVQSELGFIFAQVKDVLTKDKWCYFVGTGCQVAGLKAYLKKDYPKLITSDIVCHGAPSQALFDKHIKYLEDRYHDKVVNYYFRDNESWGGCEICEFENKEPVVNPSYELSPYLYSFMYGMTLRQSCYNCKFACVPRQGDITLADFWGVKEFFPEINDIHGVSLVLINTQSGKTIWELIKNNYEYYRSSISDAAKYNGNLVKVLRKPIIRDSIYKQIELLGYNQIARTTFKSKKKWKIKLFFFIKKNRILNCFLRLYRILKR
jgi:coenzyme F420-reducing hydrogenase beta subunit